MSDCGAGVSFSWRYFVMGVYKDRDRPLVHWYPLPFVRLSFCREEH